MCKAQCCPIKIVQEAPPPFTGGGWGVGEGATCRAIANFPPTLTLPRQGGGDYFVQKPLLQISNRTALCKTKNIITFFLTLVVFCLATAALATDKPSGQEILEKVDAIRAPGNSFVFNLKITHDNDSTVADSEFLVRVKDSQKSLVVYSAPATSRGRVLLMVQDNMWIYLPGAGNPIRISPQQQIMGGVSNADVARVVFSLDYTVESVEERDLGELELLLTPKSKGAAYGKVLLRVEKNGCKPLKAEFYALSGMLLKTVFYKGYQNILGQERPMILEIHDNIKKSEIIVMHYQDMRLEETPDIYFQKTYMERAGKNQGTMLK